MKRKCVCDYCGKEFYKETGEINRAFKKGLSIYCNKTCGGLGRRLNKSEKQLKEEKRIYDIEYRKNNREKLKNKKSEYFKKTYNREEASRKREEYKLKNQEIEKRRREYMKSEKYKIAKKKYDRIYTAKKNYGEEYGECMALALDIRDECLNKMSDIEIRKQKQILNKKLKRRRKYETINSTKFKRSSLGNIE